MRAIIMISAAVVLWGSCLVWAESAPEAIPGADSPVPETPDPSAGSQKILQPETFPAIMDQARDLMAHKRYEEAAALLDAESGRYPNHFDLEILLGKALLGRCRQMSKSGREDISDLVDRPYAIGMRLNKMFPYRPEPYYLLPIHKWHLSAPGGVLARFQSSK